MSALLIRIRLGSKFKAFQSQSKHMVVGRARDCDLVLPFPWLAERHLVLEIHSELLRIRLGQADAKAYTNGVPLTTDWSLAGSPVRITIPAPKGVLQLQVEVTDPDYQVMVLSDTSGRTAGSLAADDPGAEVLALDRFGGAGDAADNSVDTTNWQMPGAVEAGDPEKMTGGQWASIVGVAMVFLVLIGCAFGVNRYRRWSTSTREAAQVKEFEDRVGLAQDLMRKKDYAGAKAALDAAADMTSRYGHLARRAEDVAVLRERPEIQMGARGLVEMDGHWLSPETARQWRMIRTRDDPKIAELEQRASVALANKLYDEAKLACEDALRIVAAHPVHPHPREAAIRSQLVDARNQAMASEMQAKGLVLYQNQWMTPEEKVRREQTAKGLVEFEGTWMTKAEADAAARRGGTGKVLYQGKWMTPDEKMAAQGYVKFEGQWMRPEERDAIVLKRDEEKERAAAATREAAEAKVAAERAEKLKGTAYAKSQEFVVKNLNKSKTAKFEEFTSPKVHVAFDDGWYIVRAVVDGRVYYCKLRPVKDNEWEAATTLFAD